MRLLNTETMTVEDGFFGDSTPEYAILSHTWGNEEVTFQDLQNHKGDKKHGYHKIKKTCETARKHGFEYAWVDTCCIDKSSSAELSEAINSMFRWYHQAAVCYVYLSDVDVDIDVDLSSSKFELLFSESKWFTRGWTLQELIAPSKLVFFTADWSPLRERAELSGLICHVTGIAEKFLGSRGDANIFHLLGQASIAERMNWASARQTTRTEDVAYSLLGIFEVNMPLLYGEGDRAFTRLQHEIARQSSDQSLFAWRYESNIPDAGSHGIFASRPAAFSQSGDIVPFETESETPSFSVTNRGLHITMPIYEENGLLQCRHRGDHTTIVTVPLRKIREDVYARDDTDLLGKVDYRAWRRWKRETIYITTDPRSVGMGTDDGFVIRSLPDESSEPAFSGERKIPLEKLRAWRFGEGETIRDIPISIGGVRVAFLTLAAWRVSVGTGNEKIYNPKIRSSYHLTTEPYSSTGRPAGVHKPEPSRLSAVMLPGGAVYVRIKPHNLLGQKIFFVDVIFSSNSLVLSRLRIATSLESMYRPAVLYVLDRFPTLKWTRLEAICRQTSDIADALTVSSLLVFLPLLYMWALDSPLFNKKLLQRGPPSLINNLRLVLNNYYISRGWRIGFSWLLPVLGGIDRYKQVQFRPHYARQRLEKRNIGQVYVAKLMSRGVGVAETPELQH
ncbi:hypothetical protein EG329_009954 [Mollisiaceae sp. DMI_Dod_QoI]|nr:hypothetical protein EG329_009954 [Helotiales sp. DMI_Dod_QoI]